MFEQVRKEILNKAPLVADAFLEPASEEATPSHSRDLHALVNYEYTGDFLSLK
ncbi:MULTISPECIES: hypothetical protein [Vibrio harveyi group]|uniref:hypothetical protein n=1 Tax=Vibrio harveyi group TaxID=717610 RepID=UPI0015DE9160|nr:MULTISPECIES: hypothetical protein [Vibrio harveyi group]WEK81896.1 hypothetical protein PY250_23575 [Vibrio alginolyticus]